MVCRHVFVAEAGTADLDLSTDTGTVGRVSVKRGTQNTLALDLKGTAWHTPHPTRRYGGTLTRDAWQG
jgi:hypothetical protein